MDIFCSHDLFKVWEITDEILETVQYRDN